MRYTANEIDEMVRRNEDRADWDRVRAMSDDDVEAAIDREDEGTFDLSTAVAGNPRPKAYLTVRVDTEVAEHFAALGDERDERVNSILRAHMDAQRDDTREAIPPSSTPSSDFPDEASDFGD